MQQVSAAPTQPRPSSIARTLQSWQYHGGKRDARIDLLRGFAGFAMIVDHIGRSGGAGSFLFVITGGNRFFVSAAEAFVFISGVVMGIVYGGTVRKDGAAAVLRKSTRRAGMLYVLCVSLTLILAALATMFRLHWAPDLSRTSIASWLAGVLTLHRAYFLTDVLLLYTLLVLAAGPVLIALHRGHTKLVLAGSWGLWALWQVSPENAQIPWQMTGAFAFPVPAWQAVFMTGVILGFHRQVLAHRLQRVPMHLALAVSGVLAIALLALWLAVLTPFAVERRTGLLAALLLDKDNVAAGRVLTMAVFTVFSYALVTLAWAPVRTFTGRLLLPLGEKALFAYVAHLFIVALVDGARIGDGDRGPAAAAIMSGVQVAGVAVVWWLIRLFPNGGSDMLAAARRCGGAVRTLGGSPARKPLAVSLGDDEQHRRR